MANKNNSDKNKSKKPVKPQIDKPGKGIKKSTTKNEKKVDKGKPEKIKPKKPAVGKESTEVKPKVKVNKLKKRKKRVVKAPLSPRAIKIGVAMKLFKKLSKFTKRYFQKKKAVTLNYAETRAYVSENLYPLFKGQDYKKVKAAEIYAAIEAVENKLSKESKYVNPLTELPESYKFGIDWFSTDEFMSTVLIPGIAPKLLRLQFSAGPLGDTGVFDSNEYDYQILMQDMIESIRQEVDNKSEASWNGLAVLRDGFKDDGHADSYIFRYILYINNIAAVDTNEVKQTRAKIKAPTPEELAEQERIRRQAIDSGKKIDAQTEAALKGKDRRTAERPTEKEKPTGKEMKVEPEGRSGATRGEQINALEQSKIKELEMLRKDYDDGIFDKNEYKAERQAINSRYEKLIDSLEKGGIVK